MVIVDPDERHPSPYTPGFNQSPAMLAGRDEVLDAADEALAIAAEDGRTPAPLLIVGSRGVGKTVLLAEVASRAGTRYGWPRLHVEMSSGAPFTPKLLAVTGEVAAQFDAAPARDRMRRSETVVRAQIAGIGGEMHFTPATSAPPDPSGALRSALRNVMGRAVDAGSGVVATLDELQSADGAELAQLAGILQEGTGAGWPLVVVGAGLADMRRPEHTVSYLERADWYEIGVLGPADTAEALAVPAERAGRPFDPDALEHLVAHTGGYPFAIQVYGHQAWRASAGADRITLDAARVGAEVAARRLEGGLYASRWEQSSPKEREYLAAAAAVAAEGAVTGRSVADRLGVTVRQVSYLRDALIKKGTLIAVADQLRFAVPGMADWIRDHDGKDPAPRGGAAGTEGAPAPGRPRPGAGKGGDRRREQAVRAEQQRRGRPGRDFGR